MCFDSYGKRGDGFFWEGEKARGGYREGIEIFLDDHGG